MSKLEVGRRIGLDRDSSLSLENTVKELRESKNYIKINESKLASKIIKVFYKKYYDKHKDEIESEFFDQKMYLKEIIRKSESNEELMASMSSFVEQKKRRRKKRT